MEARIVLVLGAEGGTATVFASTRGSKDVFWREISEMSYELPDEEDIPAHTSRSEPTERFLEALPRYWWMLYPITVDPALTEVLRAEYRRRSSAEPEIAQEALSRAWRQVLGWTQEGSGDV